MAWFHGGIVGWWTDGEMVEMNYREMVGWELGIGKVVCHGGARVRDSILMWHE